MVKLDGVAWHGHPTKKGSIGILYTLQKHSTTTETVWQLTSTIPVEKSNLHPKKKKLWIDPIKPWICNDKHNVYICVYMYIRLYV